MEIKDFLGSIFVAIAHKPLRVIAHIKNRQSMTGKALLKRNLSIYYHHYYHPFITENDLYRPLHKERNLPSLKMNMEQQLAFLSSLKGGDELADVPDQDDGTGNFYYENGTYPHGDADILYSLIRTKKPSKIIEIGSGFSTKIASKAIKKNSIDSEQYKCRHVCIEPYEMPWLADYDIELIRKRAELCDVEIFDELGEGDILFIDSSHIIRPQGDVLFEIMELLPRLKKGVIIHIHDIYTPYDYPERWLLDQGLLWNEQYLLEAFLSMNDAFEILLATNWIANKERDKIENVLPNMKRDRTAQPSSFWLRKV